MRAMKIAAVQMVSTPDWGRNRDSAARLIAQAAQAGAQLVALPEYFCVMGQRDTDKLALQERPGAGPIQDMLASAARALGLWIVGGTLPLSLDTRSEHRVHNSSLAFSPQGECVARYDKVHLFRFHDGERTYDEAAVLEAGRAPVLFELPSRDGHTWRIGMSVCYDLRFPELYRAYAAQGADLLLVPSAFTYVTGQAHWAVLLRARAIENLACVVAAAQGGVHDNGRRTWGHSLVIDAWGQVLAELLPSEVARRRAQLPALAHRVLP